MSWQPIETAPMDGTRVLLWDGRNMGVADYAPYSWNPECGDWQEADEVFSDPTHWMPLPEPPK